MKKLALLLLVSVSACWAKETLNLLISPDEISGRMQQVAAQINESYEGESLTIIMIMKGAMCVTADLIRHLNMPVNIEYVKASSYGKNGTSRGELTVIGLDQLDVAGKNVLLVDDIFDSGHTMTTLFGRVQEMGPKSLKTCVLLVKDVLRNTVYYPDYVLFTIEDRFVVGYGLDYKEYYRELPGIYELCL